MPLATFTHLDSAVRHKYCTCDCLQSPAEEKAVNYIDAIQNFKPHLKRNLTLSKPFQQMVGAC